MGRIVIPKYAKLRKVCGADRRFVVLNEGLRSGSGWRAFGTDWRAFGGKVCASEAVGEASEAKVCGSETVGGRSEAQVCGSEAVGEASGAAGGCSEAAGGAWEAVGGWVAEIGGKQFGRFDYSVGYLLCQMQKTYKPFIISSPDHLNQFDEIQRGNPWWKLLLGLSKVPEGFPRTYVGSKAVAVNFFAKGELTLFERQMDFRSVAPGANNGMKYDHINTSFNFDRTYANATAGCNNSCRI